MARERRVYRVGRYTFTEYGHENHDGQLLLVEGYAVYLRDRFICDVHADYFNPAGSTVSADSPLPLLKMIDEFAS